MKKIIFIKKDKSIQICTPCDNKLKEETEEDFLNRIVNKVNIDNYSYEFIDDSEIPNDVPIEALIISNGKVKIDKKKLEEINYTNSINQMVGQKKQEILERQAIEELKLSGKIPKDYIGV